jgi:hypothetical protein
MIKNIRRIPDNSTIVEYLETLDWIQQSIEKTISKNSLRCFDPQGSKGHCLRISDELMWNLVELGKKKPFVECKIIHRRKPNPHFWVCVDGLHIDLTARQFDPEEPCPKIWREEKALSKGLYSVEKGKGLILFQLIPLYPNHDALSKLKPAYRALKRFAKTILHATNERFTRWPKQENVFR